MMRGPWIAVAVALLAAGAVALLAFQAARRDRTALVASFAEEHLSRLRYATRDVESELEDVTRDLEFAARLVDAADSAADRERELRALLAVVRAYRMVVVRDGEGRQQLSVVDPFAPAPWSAAPFEAAFAETARRSSATGALAVSGLVPGPTSPWYRVFALPLSHARSGAASVAILVDQRDSFERLRVLAPDPATQVMVLTPEGLAAPMTPASLTAPLASAPGRGPLAPLLQRLRAGGSGWLTLPARDAVALGLADAEAVAAFAPVREGAGRRWTVAVLDSTDRLRSKERAVTLQLAAVGATVALVLSILAVYLVGTARREIAIRERLRAAEQLLRAEKLATVGVLAAGIAHEIGTPLGVVRGRAERIADKLGADHPQADGARTIVREIDRVARIIRELLDFSRPSQARAVPVSLAEVAQDALDLVLLQAQARGVTVALELAPDLPAISADPDQLQQVLVNLLLNGMDACQAGGRVTIRARARDEGLAAIEVEDDGAGIPRELQNRVFDPFFTTKKRGQGTGLGLTVVAQLVRNHGGEIDLESEVGRGTRVRLAWPLASRVERIG